MQREYDLMTLSNGIRVVHMQVPSTKIAHCGIMLDIGSRDERPDQQGIAHFWEHMAFKGTKRRKAYHILNRIDSLGGELNAYTTKEKICFYSSVIDHHLEKPVELLADITFQSVFPEKHLEKEKNVILEEMMMYQDSPEDAIQDEFDEVIFGDHQLGKNILGNEESIRSFTRADFERFIHQNLSTDKVIFSSVGSYGSDKIFRLVEKHLSHIPAVQSNNERSAFLGYKPLILSHNKFTQQAQCAIGTTAYPIGHPNRIPFFLLVNLLGGPGMNSRLNLAIREKFGFVYAIDATYTPYIDTGLFGIFFGTDKKYVNRVFKLVEKEFARLREVPLGERQLQAAKDQLKGQLAIAEENNNSLMLMMAKSLLDLGEVRSLDNLFEVIDNITSQKIQEVATDMLAPERLSKLIYNPNP